MTDQQTKTKGIASIAKYSHREGNTLQVVSVFYDMDRYMFFGHYQDNLKVNRFEEISSQHELEEELTAFYRPISRKGSRFKVCYANFTKTLLHELKDKDPSTVNINYIKKP